MLASTRCRVVAEIARLPLSTYDTVLTATPACRATSVMVTMSARLAAPCSVTRRLHPATGERQTAHRSAWRLERQVEVPHAGRAGHRRAHLGPVVAAVRRRHDDAAGHRPGKGVVEAQRDAGA